MRLEGYKLPNIKIVLLRSARKEDLKIVFVETFVRNSLRFTRESLFGCCTKEDGRTSENKLLTGRKSTLDGRELVSIALRDPRT